MTPDHRDRFDAATVHDLFDYDAELRHYHKRLRTAIDVRPADHVLDIGCGTGQTTRAAAGAAVSGRALGIDISARMLARARQLSLREGQRNVSFAQADAQIHSFPPERFDLAISRFGTEHALSQLGAALAAHESRSGVLFDSHAWLITARRL